MNNFVINEEDVLLKLNNLKIDKLPGIDNIYLQVLKEVKIEIKDFLTKLFNLLISTGKSMFIYSWYWLFTIRLEMKYSYSYS